MTTTAEKTITPRILAFRFEVTDMCDKDWLAKNRVAKVFELHVYNERIRTHCCEMTPSYAIHFVSHQWTWDPQFDSTTDAGREFADKVAEEFGDMDAKQDLVSYMHVSSIEKTPFNRRARYGTEQRFLVRSVEECRGETSEEATEEAWEYLRCNEM